MEDRSRRQFIFRSATGLTTAWMLANWTAVLSAHEHAHQADAVAPPKLEFFTPGQATEIEAISAQIIPSEDGSPGAREAHIVYFIDRALSTFEKERQPAYTLGLKTLHEKVAQMFPGKANFIALSNEEQIRLLTAIETTEFFEQVRVHTIMGFLADPSYGGNFNEIGWKLIGFNNLPSHQHPFGYYDAEATKESA